MQRGTKSCESNEEVISSFGSRHVRQYRYENENDSLKPPKALLARLSAKKASNAPLKTRCLPFMATFIRRVARMFKSRTSGYKTLLIPYLSIIVELVTVTRLIAFKEDHNLG